MSNKYSVKKEETEAAVEESKHIVKEVNSVCGSAYAMFLVRCRCLHYSKDCSVSNPVSLHHESARRIQCHERGRAARYRFQPRKGFWNASEWLLKFSRQAAAKQPESVSFSRSRGLRFAAEDAVPVWLDALVSKLGHFSLIQRGPKIRGFCGLSSAPGRLRSKINAC